MGGFSLNEVVYKIFKPRKPKKRKQKLGAPFIATGPYLGPSNTLASIIHNNVQEAGMDGSNARGPGSGTGTVKSGKRAPTGSTRTSTATHGR